MARVKGQGKDPQEMPKAHPGRSMFALAYVFFIPGFVLLLSGGILLFTTRIKKVT